MKRTFQALLVVIFALPLLSACQGVVNVEASSLDAPLTGKQIVADGYDFAFEGEESFQRNYPAPPLVTPTVVEEIAVTGPSLEVEALPKIPAPPGCNATFNRTYESKILRLINKERAKHKLGKLSVNAKLYTAARKHSLDMACNNYFSHDSPDGTTPFDRIRDAGYNYRIAAENLYAGNGSYNNPAKAVEAWMNSEGHRKNILTAELKHIGISYVYTSSSTYGGYYTVTFGAPLK